MYGPQLPIRADHTPDCFAEPIADTSPLLHGTPELGQHRAHRFFPGDSDPIGRTEVCPVKLPHLWFYNLCGSSARKLRRGKGNLLGGRAWRHEMHPLVFAELEDLDLLTALNRGLIPAHYLSPNYRKSLRAYLND